MLAMGGRGSVREKLGTGDEGVKFEEVTRPSKGGGSLFSGEKACS